MTMTTTMTSVPDTCYLGPRRVEKPAAALFDVDGTLVDSMSRFFPSWGEAGAKHGGLCMPEDQFYDYAGRPLPDIVEDLYRKQHSGADPPEGFVAAFLESKKRFHARREERDGPPPAIECVAAIARAWKAQGIPVVCATSGLRDHVEPHLAAAGLGDLFPPEKIVCAADLPRGRGKPLPDIFLKAAEVAGADASQCVAYEDAEAGLRSAWRAGCAVVDVTGLPGYPLPEGLRKAKIRQVEQRDWLPPATIVVTGGTRGIGRAVVTALARRLGVVIYLGCRDLKAGEAVVQGSSNIVPLLLDVTDSASIKAAVATLAASGRHLDAVVNNAGIMDEGDVDRTLAVNLDGVAAITEALAPLLGMGGRVVNVSSGAGLRLAASLSAADRDALDGAADVAEIHAVAQRLAVAAAGTPGTPVYGVSKAALNAYTRLAAREHPRLRINACSPGFCRTEIAGSNADYSKRTPKEPSLGADVVVKVLFDDAFADFSCKFVKECSKPGTLLEDAVSRVEPWQ